MSADVERLFNEAEQHRINGEYDQAIEKYKQVLEWDDSHAHAHLGLGLVYSFIGEFDLALVEMERAVELAPQDIECRIKLAMTYLMLGMFDEGKRELFRILRLDPQNPEAIKQLSYFPDVDLAAVMAGEIPLEE